MIDRLQELLLKDFWLKLFSLALAILIWFTIFQAIQQQGSPVTSFSATKVKERTFYNLPVSKVSSSADVSAFKINPEEVQVTVQGEAKGVDGLMAEEIRARVDLSGLPAKEGQHRRIEVWTPPGISYTKIEPAEVEVIPPPKTATAAN